MTISNEDARRMRDRKDWRGLWLAAVPMVKSTISRLLQAGRITSQQASDDLLQEGYLAAGKAIRSWDPAAGSLSTWVSHAVRGAMLNHLMSERSIVGGRRPTVVTMSMEDDITPDLSEPSVDEHAHSAQLLSLRLALMSLPTAEQELITRLYGIGRDTEAMDTIARGMGLAKRTAWRRVKNILEKLAQSAVCGDNSVSTDFGAYTNYDDADPRPLRTDQSRT